MGVTGFFSWVEKNHPGMTCAPENVKERVDHFMIDYNALIYQVLKIIRFNQDLPEESKTWTEIQWKSHLIEQVVQYTSDLIAWVNPRKRAVIAIDGTVPRAKIEQQRNRRFKSTWTAIWEPKVSNETPKNDVKFSISQITVGTSFWGNCVDALITAARQGRLSPMHGRHDGITPLVNNIGHETIEFVVEIWDAQMRGEGEHKIIQNMLAEANQISNDHVLIYGLDADLLMLALRMTLIYSKISILRENTSERADKEVLVSRLPKWKTPFFWVDMLSFRKSWFARIMEISQEVNNNIKVNWTVQTLVADAMILYCFLGNDFLQCHTSLEIFEGGIDYLWKLYVKTRFRMHGISLVNLPAGTINRDFLFNLIKNLAYSEVHQAKWLQNRRRTTARIRGSKNSRILWEQIWANEELRTCYEWTDWTHPYAIEQYRRNHFHWEKTSLQPSFVRSLTGQRVCREYIRGLDFVLQYYWNEQPDWEFYYPWDSPPLFQDLVEYLQLQGEAQPIRLKFQHGPQNSIVPLFQGFWVFHTSQRKYLGEIPNGLMDTHHWETPDRFTMAGTDKYHMFHLEPRLPPISWNFWRAQWDNWKDDKIDLLKFHLTRKWRMFVKT